MTDLITKVFMDITKVYMDITKLYLDITKLFMAKSDGNINQVD